MNKFNSSIEYYVVDVGDQFILYSGSLENCMQFMDESYGGLQILDHSELTQKMIQSITE